MIDEYKEALDELRFSPEAKRRMVQRIEVAAVVEPLPRPTRRSRALVIAAAVLGVVPGPKTLVLAPAAARRLERFFVFAGIAADPKPAAAQLDLQTVGQLADGHGHAWVLPVASAAACSLCRRLRASKHSSYSALMACMVAVSPPTSG